MGFNYRLTDVMAVLGLRQLDELDAGIQQRRANAQYLSERLAGVPGLQLPTEQPDGESSFNLYSLLLEPGRFRCDRDELVERLNAAGVAAAVHYPRSLHEQPAFGELTQGVRLPVSEDLSQRILSLPVYPGLRPEELDHMVDAVRTVAAAASN